MNDFVPGSKKGEVLRYFDSESQAFVLQCNDWVYDHAQMINRRLGEVIWSTRAKCDIQKTADLFVEKYDDGDSLELSIQEQCMLKSVETNREKNIYSII